MATTALAVAWTCLVVRTALVADNLCDRHGYGSVLRRMAACWRRLRQRETFPKSSNTAGYSGASRFRYDLLAAQGDPYSGLSSQFCGNVN